MAAMQKESFCVLEYAKCSSVASVRRAFLRKYGIVAPGHQSILRWFRQFRETGCMCKGKSTGMHGIPLLPWPSRSPDLTPFDFFLWGYVKEKVYVPPMPTALQALQTDIGGNMLLNVWTELDYRWDARLVTRSAHIEHL
ncbi:hypothetical protein AVEN_79858-1 [Araneus ventricosus]|uniref:DUF4817 domain-containing protein n=1 Tax=Araneus ventricosus TaxID=182803 RepID=A0A4Y2QRR3_ARAVE|nr:hypothetical protein AVEN_79858-1 [Araneus ventricosus]